MIHLSDIVYYCEDAAANVEDGARDPLRSLAEMRAVIAAAQDALEVIEPLALAEAEKYHERTFTHAGLTFKRSDGRRFFSYHHLREWDEARKALGRIEERAKNAALMQEKKLVVASEDDGVVEVPAIITYGKPSISIVNK